MEEYCFFDAECSLVCSAKMRYLSGFDVVGPLWRKERWADENNASSSIEERFVNMHGCSLKALAEVELVYRFGTYCNVQRIPLKWKLFFAA